MYRHTTTFSAMVSKGDDACDCLFSLMRKPFQLESIFKEMLYSNAYELYGFVCVEIFDFFFFFFFFGVVTIKGTICLKE